MSKGIEEIKEIEERLGYKNSELLRFHITEKIEELNETVERNGNNNFGELSGDIFASLIDLLVVLLFGQSNEGLSCRNICVLLICILIFIPFIVGFTFVVSSPNFKMLPLSVLTFIPSLLIVPKLFVFT